MAFGQNQPGAPKPATATDLVQAVRLVAAAVAALPLLAAKVKNDSRISPYETADLVREVQDRLFPD